MMMTTMTMTMMTQACTQPMFLGSSYCVDVTTGAVLEENIWGRGQDKKLTVVALKTQAKTTKSTTPTLKKTLPVYLFAGFAAAV